MAFEHESFWVAVAAAAPVIAVANTVAITHALDPLFDTKSLLKSRWKRWFIPALVLTGFNFGAQTVALYRALRSLLVAKDAASANYFIWAEVLGLFAVGVVVFCDYEIRYVFRREAGTSGSKTRMNG
jgi:hypothetical protein